MPDPDRGKLVLHQSGFYAVHHVSVGHLVLPTNPGNVQKTAHMELLEFAQLSSAEAPDFTAAK